MRTMNLPITWIHVTTKGRRAIVHRRHIFDESDDESELDFIENIKKYDPEDEDYEALFDDDRDDSKSLWWDGCSEFDIDRD
jgi:hypothetical protein